MEVGRFGATRRPRPARPGSGAADVFTCRERSSPAARRAWTVYEARTSVGLHGRRRGRQSAACLRPRSSVQNVFSADRSPLTRVVRRRVLTRGSAQTPQPATVANDPSCRTPARLLSDPPCSRGEWVQWCSAACPGLGASHQLGRARFAPRPHVGPPEPVYGETTCPAGRRRPPLTCHGDRCRDLPRWISTNSCHDRAAPRLGRCQGYPASGADVGAGDDGAGSVRARPSR
jgi:hypothetical protein